MRIAIFGLGYVGAVTAAGLASQGHRGMRSRRRLGEGRSHPVRAESGCRAWHRANSSRPRSRVADSRATTDPVVALDQADVSLICVGTPSSPHGGTDLTYLRRALEDIRQGLEAAHRRNRASMRWWSGARFLLVPGTMSFARPSPVLAAARLGGGDGDVPEFLREGSGVADFFNPPFVVARHCR